MPDAVPISGTDRYGTALRVVERFFPGSAVVGIASGERFPDALGGGVHAARLGGGLLLSPASALTSDLARYLSDEGSPRTRYLYGGTAALSTEVEHAVAAAG